jgi:DNA-binding transcriptional LysR family regulator
MNNYGAMNAPMSLDRLVPFLAVAEAGSFAAAAARLGVDRSAVSRAVSALEAELDARLFTRSTRRVALTATGAALRGQAGPLVARLQYTVAGLAGRGAPPTGELRLGVPSDAFAGFFSEVVVGFCARHPGLHLDIRVCGADADVVALGLDAAIRAAPGRLADSALVASRLFDLELQVFASPAYLARHGRPRTPADAAGHDWVVRVDQPLPRPLLAPRRPPRVRCDQPHLLLQAVRAGLGLGLLPTLVAREHVLAGQLACALPGLAIHGGAAWFVHPGGRTIPARVRAFRDYLRANPPVVGAAG